MKRRYVTLSRWMGLLLAPLFLASSMHAQTPEASVLAELEWRNIGPAIMGGRISDLAVVESDPAVFYVGTATGGLWKTTNNGTTFAPAFDDQPTSSVGDVTLSPSNPNIVWVGTGEPQNRQSSPWGNGVYKSTDGGGSWQHMGLTETRHIARIVIHPTNPDVVYVAAVGHLWGANPERGVYKTSDGGATWDHVLYLDDDTGAIDMAMDPGDPQTVFVAMYQRRRTNFGFNGGGPGSGLYRTTDGGANWTELTHGLPEGDKGRIGVDIYRHDGTLVYAIVEADPRRPGQNFFGGGGPPGGRKNGVYRSTDRGETWEHLSETNNRPMYYSQLRIDPNDPERIYLGGSSLYRSSDGGKTFTNDAARGVHLDHHALWINPHNSNHLLLGSDGGISLSYDRSEHWRQLTNITLAQFYEIGVDMRDPYYVCGGLQDNGSWCGPSATRSTQGIRNADWYNVGGGDGFYTVIDPADPTVMFVESQGGNINRVDLNTMERQRIRPVARPTEDDDDRSFRWNWDTPMVLSAHDRETVYVGGNVLHKSTDRGVTWQEISPDLTRNIERDSLEIMGVQVSRPMMSRNDGISSYGTMTTLSESPLNAQLLYAGTDDGNIQGTRDGGASWTNLTEFSATWSDLRSFSRLPDQTYVSRLVASRFDEGTVYATFDGHYNDDYKPYVYVSRDYGKNWTAITEGLPAWSVNVIAEHPRNANLLFLGNEVGVYVSMDQGEHWMRLNNNLPTVPVDDIVVHPRDNDLVIGTHGRGIWIMDDIAPLEELTQDILAAEAHLFSTQTATLFNPYSPQGWTPGVYVAPNPPFGALIRYYLKEDLKPMPDAVALRGTNGGTNGRRGPAARGDAPRGRQFRGRRGRDAEKEPKAKITILDASGAVVRALEGAGKAGVQQVVWDLRIEPPYVPQEDQQGGDGFFRRAPRGPLVLPGTYTLQLAASGETLSTDVEVRGDPRIQIARADLEARQHTLMSAYTLSKTVYEAGQAVRRLTEQITDVQDLLKTHEDVPESLTADADSLRNEIGRVGREMNQASAGSRGSFAVEGSTTRPTADQLWQLEQSWEKVPPLVAQINAIINTKMPALYRQLDERGIRPDPGDPVAMPTPPGN